MKNKSFKTIAKAYLQLGKFSISIPVALTALLGYVLYTRNLHLDSWITVAGVFLLSLGSSSINQIQERRTDALMPRTKKRPLPSGTITLAGAVIFAFLTILSGSLLLYLSGYYIAVFLGLFTAFWYNVVYTPLKKLTPFAVVPGALIGALPPMIGWTAAGGSLLHPTILLVSFFLFIGQMPHYWLLLIRIGKEFSIAGMPVITDTFNNRQIRNLSFIWISSAIVTVLIFPVTGVVLHPMASVSLILVCGFFLYRTFIYSYIKELTENWRKAFMTVNFFYLSIILILMADRLIPAKLLTPAIVLIQNTTP